MKKRPPITQASCSYDLVSPPPREMRERRRAWLAHILAHPEEGESPSDRRFLLRYSRMYGGPMPRAKKPRLPKTDRRCRRKRRMGRKGVRLKA